MSRSNPTLNNNPNPCTRWYEWDGSNGTLKYYNKEEKKQATVKLPMGFIVLDKLAVVKGWHEQSQSGIFSNEVRDTTREPFIVKSHKGGVLAQGFYREIRDRVLVAGGHYTANLYVAFKPEGQSLSLGSIQLKGVALNSWVDFEKANRKKIWEKAIKLASFTEEKKGKITYRVPVFKIDSVSDETEAAAKQLDVELQVYLEAYLKRNVSDQVQQATQSRSIAPAGMNAAEEEEHEPTEQCAEEPPIDHYDDVPF